VKRRRAITAGGTLDITDGGVILQQTTNTEAEVTDLINSGINLSGTIWAGDGITSSDAEPDATHTIGVGTVQNSRNVASHITGRLGVCSLFP
jgi:hypothetical protein